ncbi:MULTISPECIES: RsmB/NOP family class I SAM-dependent RNA methyltransferase [Candidatus Ichthyocystis]|uniref:Putative ribosomal RNA small subunit methyltransferase B n=1 Tax=Candidatus Ichthyocystis hellenicum TaxID=1561003 RepID=A0A0S4M2Q1_9BURK|nr:MULTISPECIES: RsmB/NOP family class I SAM-dependent RNA methyltransferase [Ichthyocystis]CUT18053.1 putative ribosomal RNA small subunit methyltransferase B [Candidatus Ichthyocystis hellenicum]
MNEYLIQLCAEPLSEILSTPTAAADALLERYLREKRLGKNERMFVSDLYHGVIRHKKSLSFLTGTKNPGILASFYGNMGNNREERYLALCEDKRLKNAGKAVQYDIPEWAVPLLEKKIPDPCELEKFIFSINQPATIDLRVNTLKTNIHELKSYLLNKGYAVEETTWSPTALRLPTVIPFNAGRDLRFQKGHFEIQDEGSQLIAHWCQPKRHEIIVDLCSGAGGKSLALSSLMRATGRIYAFDISRKRLEKIKPRLLRSGAKNITPILLNNLNDDRLKKCYSKADRVLVDVPCSGSGTWRRHPYLKWRYVSSDIVQFQRDQSCILEKASSLVKRDGWLIYSTCSLWSEENELSIDRFLSHHPEFVRVPYHEWKVAAVDGSQHFDDAQLYTHRHQTDCFFVGILKKIS